MTEPTMVTAADIARLAEVTRATVSNWRRRHADFPAPAGGTDSSPAYDRAAVEEWLRARGALPDLPPEEKLWRAVAGSARGGDLGAAVLRAARQTRDEPLLRTLIDRYTDTAGIPVTPEPVADLMAAIAEPAGDVVLDQACGSGELLVAAIRHGAAGVYGQELDRSLAELASIRTGLEGERSQVIAGDSLRHDRYPDLRADAVLCHPPFGVREWGAEELAHDSRWRYGTPPKSEPELAWVQAAVAHLKPGGLAVMLMPPALAARGSARRIRAELVRKGAIRGIIALPAGVVRPYHVSVHLWILRNPDGAPPEDPRVLFVDAARSSDDWSRTAEQAWHRFRSGQPGDQEAGDDEADSGTVPAIDLLDETVDLTPSRHVASVGNAVAPEEIPTRIAALDRDLRDLLKSAADLAPGVGWLPGKPGEEQARTVSLADLDRLGTIAVYRATMKPRAMTLRPGDVLVPAVSDGPDGSVKGRVVPDAETGAPLGPNLHLIRPDPELIDPEFLAGFIVTPASVRAAAYGTHGSRIDVRRLTVPLLPLADQHAYGRAFRQLKTAEERAIAITSRTAELTNLIRKGLTEAAIRPRDGQNT